MSFSSYLPCGFEPASLFGDDGDDKDSCSSIVEYMTNLPLCCPSVARRTEDHPSHRRETAQGAMAQPWRPPLYRDKSLLADACSPSVEEEKGSSPSSKTRSLSIGVLACGNSVPPREDKSAPSTNTDRNSLPPDFIPPRHLFSRHVNTKRHVESTIVPKDSLSQGLRLQPKDVVCGRGAPTSTHPGNQQFKKMIKKHEMEYVCSKRNEKPMIATKLLSMLQCDGVRFVKRERNEEGSLVWAEIGEQRALEKVCQSLREDAPHIRRKMVASSALRSTRSEERREHRNRFQQSRQDTSNQVSSETGDIYDVRHRSSLATNSNARKNISHQIQNNGAFHHEECVSKECSYNLGAHYDDPYPVHIPPHLGGERMFGDKFSRE